MAVRKPLVVVSGQVRELPAGDNLNLSLITITPANMVAFFTQLWAGGSGYYRADGDNADAAIRWTPGVFSKGGDNWMFIVSHYSNANIVAYSGLYTDIATGTWKVTNMFDQLYSKVSKVNLLPASGSLNAVLESGFYRVSQPTNAPDGYAAAGEYGELIVAKGSNTIWQLLSGHTTGAVFTRVGTGTTDTGPYTFTTWVPLQEKLVSGASIKTINGQSVLGSGDMVVETSEERLRFFTANTTLTVPDGLSTVRFYVGGRGGNGGKPASGTTGGCGGGGGGGFAFGDLAVTAGDVVDVTFSAGVSQVRLNGAVVATANPGSNGAHSATGITSSAAGGTASIGAQVLNGGAYAGGVGGFVNATSSSRGAGGGGSCGSPLGVGGSGGSSSGSATSGSGGGIGGPGWSSATTNSGGGGAGEGGALTYAGGSTSDGTSRGLLTSFADPLLKHATGPRGTSAFPGTGGFGAPGGDFGGGGTAGSNNGSAGGLMGGGSGHASGVSYAGGAGGYGGGGGGGFAAAPPAAPGGAAFCFLYY